MEKLWNWEKKSNQIEQHTEKKERNWFPTVYSLYFKRGTTRMSFVFTSVLDVLKKVFNSIYTCLLIITQKEKERSFMFWLLLFYCLLSYIIDVCANRYRKWAKWVSTKTLFDRILLNLLFFWKMHEIDRKLIISSRTQIMDFFFWIIIKCLYVHSIHLSSSLLACQCKRIEYRKREKNKKLNCSFVHTFWKKDRRMYEEEKSCCEIFFCAKK